MANMGVVNVSTVVGNKVTNTLFPGTQLLKSNNRIELGERAPLLLPGHSLVSSLQYRLVLEAI